MRKRRALWAWAVLVLALLLAGCTVTSGSWSGTMVVENQDAGNWTLAAQTLDGSRTTTMELTEEELAALNVNCTSLSGKVALTLTQGTVERSVELSGVFDENVDMSDFEAGEVSFKLVFEDVEGLALGITW